MDSGNHVNALEFLVDRVRQLEAQIAFVSMTVAVLGQGASPGDPVSDRAREILEMRAAACDVRRLLDGFAFERP